MTQRLRWIPAGAFLMGSPADESERYDWEGPRHEVVVARGFWLFDTAVTQALWRAVMGKNPSRFVSPARPVEQVSWHDAKAFIERINEMIPGLDLRLPSEAQWEHACRAGTETRYSFGEEISREQVNFQSKETVSVGSLPANGWGLHEMHGNVWEWCEDHWHDSYEGAPADGSAWVDKDEEGRAFRVIRGGSWDGVARFVRSASRNGGGPGYRSVVIGFRCARVQA